MVAAKCTIANVHAADQFSGIDMRTSKHTVIKCNSARECQRACVSGCSSGCSGNHGTSTSYALVAQSAAWAAQAVSVLTASSSRVVSPFTRYRSETKISLSGLELQSFWPQSNVELGGPRNTASNSTETSRVMRRCQINIIRQVGPDAVEQGVVFHMHLTTLTACSARQAAT